MSVSVVTRPTYPLPGRQRVTFTLSGGGNFLRLWLTNAPDGSELRKKLDEAVDKSGATRVKVHEGAPTEAWTPNLDVGGVYTFKAQEYTFGASTHGGSYEGDPNSYVSETKIGSENTVSINVGERIEWRLGTGGHTSRLVAYAWSTSIQPTTLIEHGIETPAYENHSSPLAQYSALNLNVEYSAAAMTGVLSTLVGDITAVATTIRQNFNAHLSQSSVHYANDTDNTIASSYDSPSTPDALAVTLNELRKLMIRHFTNDQDGTGADTASANYHQDGSGNGVGDWRLPIAPPANGRDVWSSYVLAAELYRVYQLHRVDLSLHQAADTTNVLSGATSLMDRVSVYLRNIADLTPSSPATHNSGAVFAIANGALRG